MKKPKPKKPTRPKRSIVKQAAKVPSDSPNVAAAKQLERQAGDEARQAHKALDAARQNATRAAMALNAKEREVETVKGELEAVSAQLGGMPLDDPAAQPLGGRLRHCELLLTRLQGERGGCAETLTVAQRTVSTLEEAAARAEALQRNSGRWITLQALSEAFPLALERLLSVVRERNITLAAADDESHASGVPRVGRARLFPARDQIRAGAMDELLTILNRHMAGLTLTPSAPLSSFASNGEAPRDLVEEVEPPTDGEPVEVEAGWMPVMTTAKGGSDNA